MHVREVVLIVAIAFIFGYCVFIMGGCALSLVDGSRRMDFEIFMPYEQNQYAIEDDLEHPPELEQTETFYESWMK